MIPRPVFTPGEFARARLHRLVDNPAIGYAPLTSLIRVAEALIDNAEIHEPKPLADDGSGVSGADDHTVACPDCGGRGVTTWGFAIDVKCQSCRGKGRVSSLVLEQRERMSAS